MTRVRIEKMARIATSSRSLRQQILAIHVAVAEKVSMKKVLNAQAPSGLGLGLIWPDPRHPIILFAASQR